MAQSPFCDDRCNMIDEISKGQRHRRTMNMEPTAGDRIEAEVVLRPRHPIANAKGPLRTESVGQFEADPEVVKKVAGNLCDLGFQLLAESPTSISIAGTRKLFDRVF